MKVLLVNKFLYPRGGAETYVESLGQALQNAGHKVQYFGMYDPKNTMLNDWGLYTSSVDFHRYSADTASYPLRIIWSKEAYDKMKALLVRYKPDIVHLNNFNYQLTPSVIDACKELMVPAVMTAHDSQFVCPNHLLYDSNRNTICTKCVDTQDPIWCFKTACIHKNRVKSMIGSMEGEFYRLRDTYDWISRIICPSEFMKSVYNVQQRFRHKTVYLQNFVRPIDYNAEGTVRKDYVFYFGRISPEKGIDNIIAAAEALPDVPFVLAGSGPDEDKLLGVKNIRFVGFQHGDDLYRMIAEARLVILPSTCYENNPLAVIEAQQLGAAVLAPEYGGAKELVSSGIKDTSPEALIEAIRAVYDSDVKLAALRADSHRRAKQYLTADEYEAIIEKIYGDVLKHGLRVL